MGISGPDRTSKRAACIHVIGAVEALPFAARKWIEDLRRDDAWQDPEVVLVFAPEISAELLGYLAALEKRAVVFPGTASKLTVERVALLSAIPAVDCILCDHLPDEGAAALPAEVWMRFCELLFFPPWTAHVPSPPGGEATRAGHVMVAHAAGEPDWTITVSSSREGAAQVAPWDEIRTILEEQHAIQAVDIERLEASSSQPAGLAGMRLIAVASDKVETVLRGATAARRGGVSFFDWAAQISPMRLCVEGAGSWCVPGEAMPWRGLRRVVQYLFPGGGIALDGGETVPRHADAWPDALVQRLRRDSPAEIPGPTRCDVNETLRACARVAPDPVVAQEEFLWVRAIERAEIPPEWLNGAALGRLGNAVVRRSRDLASQLSRVAASEARVVGLFERMVEQNPELGWVGIPLFHGLCDGHLFDWRRNAAQRAWAMSYRMKVPPACLVSQRLPLSLMLGQVKEIPDAWRDLADFGARGATLRHVLRAWMPSIDGDAQPAIAAAAAVAWLACAEELTTSPESNAATMQLAALGVLYLREDDDAVLDLAGRGLSVAQVAAVAAMAWIRGRSVLAADLWMRFCRGHKPADLGELSGVAVARALITHERETADWLREVENGAPGFFAPTVPSHTRCLFFALAWHALGEETLAATWFERAKLEDPSAVVRRSIFLRAGTDLDGRSA